MRAIIRIFMAYTFLVTLSSASLETGIEWLQQNTSTKENVEAYTNISTSLQATNEAFFTLYDLNESYSSLISFSSELNTTEDIARLIIYRKLQGQETLQYVEELLKHQNADGGFGELEGYDSSILDTAFAIKALSYINKNEIIKSAVRYIKRSQQSSGAWINNVDSDTIYVTMITLDALFLVSDYNDVGNVLSLGREYLFEKKDANGLWSEVYLNALGIKVLLPLVTDKLALKNNYNYIDSIQDSDGSWSNDIYTTSLSLYSLHAYDTKVYDTPQEGTDDTSINGFIYNELNNEVLHGVKIILSGANNRIVFTDIDGKYSIDKLNTGITQMNLSFDGYQSVVYTTKLNSNTKYTINKGLNRISQTELNNISIAGSIMDSATGAILSGVQIVLTGTNNRTLYSDVNGKYNIDKLNPGITQIKFMLDGYDSDSVSVELKNNTLYTIDKKLDKVLIEAIVNILGGVVSDKGIRLSNAKVSISNLYIDSVSNSDGVYQFMNLKLKENSRLHVFVEVDGYQNQSVFVDIKNIHNGINNLTLNPIVLHESIDNNDTNNSTSNSSKIKGIVKDQLGNPLSNATVSISGSTISVVTDSAGFYSIENSYSADDIIREDYEFMLIYSADGFISKYQRFKISEPINTTLDITLDIFKDANLTIGNIELDKESYDAYSPVSIFVDMQNTGTLSQEATLLVDILHNGSVIDTIEENYQNFSLKDVRIIPNLDNERQLKWFTGIHTPGEYTAIARLLDSNGSTLSENKKAFTINISKKIETLNIKSKEKIYYINDTKDIKSYITLINYSNIVHTIKVNYFIVSPSNNSTLIYSKEIEIKPSELTKLIYLEPIPNKFLEEGQYSLLVNIEEGVVPEVVETDTMIILPLVRIVPEQSLSPKVILPEDNQRIKIKIKIYGEQ